MELEEVKTRLNQLETELDAAPAAAFATFQTPHGELQVAVTARLRQRCREGRGVLSVSPVGTRLVLVDYDDERGQLSVR